jgi:hypothetical protein
LTPRTSERAVAFKPVLDDSRTLVVELSGEAARVSIFGVRKLLEKPRLTLAIKLQGYGGGRIAAVLPMPMKEDIQSPDHWPQH